MPVPFIQLNQVGEGTGGASARLQAIQTAIAAQGAKKNALYNLLGDIASPLINKGLEIGGDVLERRATRQALDQQSQAAEKFYNSQLDAALASQLGSENIGGESGQPLQLSPELLDGVFVKNDKGQVKLGASTAEVRPTTPAEAALRETFKNAVRAGMKPDDVMKAMNLTQITPQGVKDRYSAEDIKAEYLSKEGLENAGAKSRRNLERDLGLRKDRADIANTYDTMNKRGVPGSSGKEAADKLEKQAQGVTDALQVYVNTLDKVNKAAPSIFQRGTGAALNLVKIPTEAGVQMKSLYGLRSRLRIEIARLGDVGNLTKDEQESAAKLLPDPMDTITQQKNDLAVLTEYLASKTHAPLEPSSKFNQTPSGSSPKVNVPSKVSSVQEKINSLNDQQYKAVEKLMSQGMTGEEALNKVLRGGK